MLNKVTIIVPVRFRPDLTKVCLDNLFRYTDNFNLIIVQDGKDDEMTALIKNYNAKVVYHEKSLGYVKAINAGYKEIANDNEYVMFLNADTCVTPGWLDNMLDSFKIDNQIALVGPTFTAWNGIQSIENNKNYGDYNFTDEMTGVCMLLKKSACDELISKNKEMKVIGDGILDERFEMGGGDDNDICMRLKLLGYKLVICRKSFIYHYISASFRKLFNDDEDYSKRYSTHVFAKFKDKFKQELGHKPRIFISVPCQDGFIHNELSIKLVEWSHNTNISVTIKPYPYLSPLDNARNRAVKDFLEDYYDYFFHIDDDVIPPSNCLQELLKADKDIIAPLCFTLHQDDKGIWFPIVVAHRYDKNHEYRPYYPEDNLDGIHETDVITGGCHLVKRQVFEKLERPYYFVYHKNGLVEYSEDFVFSQQCQKLGYKLYTHYGLQCKHFRLTDIKTINDLMVQYGK